MQNQGDRRELPRKEFSLFQREQDAQRDQVHEGVVELGWVMESNCVGEMNAPRKGWAAHTAVATAVEEAPDPTNRVAEYVPGGGEIENCNDAVFMLSRPRNDGDHGENFAAEAGQAAKLERVEFILVLHVVGQLLKDERDTCANDARNEGPEPHIQNFIRLKAVQMRPLSNEPHSDQERDDDHHAVGMDGHWPQGNRTEFYFWNGKEDREHSWSFG